MVVGTEIEAQASLLMTLAAELPTQAVPVEVLLTVIFATTVVGNKDIKAQASLLMTLAAELPTQAVVVEVLLTVIFGTTVVGNKDIEAQASLLDGTGRVDIRHGGRYRD